MAIYNILYISKSVNRLGDQDLLQLLETSRDWNVKHGITGMLVYLLPQNSQAGRFMQVIEGKREDITSLFHNIKSDRRHHQITLLHEGFINHRNFKDWTMGFNKTTMDNGFDVPGYIAPETILATNQQEAKYNIALNYLKSFYSIR